MDPVQEELVNWLSPKRRERADTTTAIGIAKADSSKGLVPVEFDASVLSDDDSYSEKTTITKLPTTVYCQEGDTVIITLFGVGGVKKPTVTGVSGGGDAINERIVEIEQHQPSGTITIEENGLYDVRDFATADVAVSGGGGGGGFDWTQLAWLPHFNNNAITATYGKDFDASGMWCRSANSAFDSNTNLKSFTAGTMDTADCTSFASMFRGCTALESCDMSGVDASLVTSMSSMFYNCQSLTSFNSFAGKNLSHVTNAQQMFYNCQSLTSADFTGTDFSTLAQVGSWFQGCSALTSFDSSGFTMPMNTAQNQNNNVFNGCTCLVSLNAKAWNDNAAGQSFCASCSALESAYFPNQSKFFQYMFRYCSSLVCLIWGLDNSATRADSQGSYQLQGTPIEAGTGYVYVADSKVSTYKASGLLANYASQVKPISECPQQYLDLYNIDPSDYQ